MAEGQRTLYIPDDIWVPLRAKLVLEGQSVSAWFREQARQYVRNGQGDNEPGVLDEGDPAFFVPERESNA